MAVAPAGLSVFWIIVGFVLTIGGTFGVMYYVGRKTAKRLGLEDRGEWERPLPQSFPPDHVIAVYKRRKREHRHDRHFYRRRHSRTRK